MSRPGNRVLVIYEDISELLAFVVPFIKDGLAAGERCLYVIDDLERPDLARALAAGGIDVELESRRAALAFMNAREFASPPPFDARRTVELLRERVNHAGAGGFGGLRVAAHATWALTAGVSAPSLLEYEALVDRAAGPGRLAVASLYRRDRFDQGILERLVRGHTRVIASDYVYLSLSAFFQNLARADLRELAKSARERIVPKGEFFFRQGEPAPEVFVLTRGAAKVVRVDGEGHSVVLRLVKLLQPFAEREYLGAATRLASAQALEDSRVLVWDASAIDRIIVRNPAVALNNIRMLAEMVETERRRLEDFAGSGVERRLARLLLRLAQSIGRETVHGVAVEISLSREDLAELVIATPYTISRVLADWRRLDIVDALRERILLLDPDRLAAIAEMHDAGGLPRAGD